jgi:hypothetical protein
MGSNFYKNPEWLLEKCGKYFPSPIDLQTKPSILNRNPYMKLPGHPVRTGQAPPVFPGT